jgi:hypothetical protein
MAVAVPSRIGQIAGAGDVDALFLEVFSGLVLERYDFTQLTDDRQIERKITSGKSA